jgi:hypothetical protein
MNMDVVITCLGKTYVARISIKRNSNSSNSFSVELGHIKNSLEIAKQKQNSEKGLG